MYRIEKLRRLWVIQDIAPGESGSLVFRQHTKTRRKLRFKLPEVRRMLKNAMTRRERNHGHARSLARQLTVRGSCAYELWDAQAHMRCGMLCTRTRNNPKAYWIYVWGQSAQKILARINEKWERSLTLQASAAIHETTREANLGKNRVHIPTKRNRPQAVLTRHFRGSTVTWGNVIEIIGETTGKHSAWIHRRLRKNLDPRGISIIRIGTFVFRVDLIGGAHKIISIDAPVEFWTTNDNTHAVYRRTRNKLRQALKRERKEKLRVREQVRQWRKTKQRMRILTAK